MRVSVAWLREMVKVDADDAEIARRLTMAGLEVEAMERVGEEVDAVRVGEVRGSARHPGADHLSVVEVYDGTGLRRVVCGAPNVPPPGGRVALALPDTALPSGVPVAARAVRGVESAGMLCSEAELGIGDDAGGLLLLPEEARAGGSIAEALSLHDTVLDLGVAPNRPDCLGHVGVAREVAALFGVPLTLPAVDVATWETAPPVRDFVSVDVQDAERCPRYVARGAWDVVVGTSPFWLRWRLRLLGLRALGNVVDVTNYVLLESGHPLHAFDLDRIADGRIVVRRARPGEILVTLDDTARELCPDDLVIADPSRALALAGVMGGRDSEVQPQTRRLALEAAAFEPRGIRRTSRRLGLRTEASIRFERGCDVEGAEWASRRAARLLARIAGARLLAGSVDVAGRTSAREIRLRPERCRALLGLDLSDAEIRATLERLDLSVRPDGSGSVATLLVGVPGHRGDLAREADLAEEIVRIRGLDHVPATLPSGGAAPAAAASGLAEAARDALMAAGMHETVSLAFAPPATLGAPGLPRAVVIRNPLREDCSTLRTWLLPGLLGALRRNCERGVTDVSIFEVGRVFTAHEEAGLPDERLHAAGLLSGARAAWLSRGEPVDFFDLKGLIEEVGSTMRLGFGFVASSHAFLHPGAQAVVSTEQGPCGWAGALHPALLRNEGLPAALAFEIDLETMALPGPAKLRPIPRHPAVVRDLSFFVDANVAWARLDDALRSTREPWLEAVRILEDYRDPARVPAGQKGIFLSLRYRASDRTLTDDEANAVHERVVAALARGFSISRR